MTPGTVIRRDRCEWCGGFAVRGSKCPMAVVCPTCAAGRGQPCRRPSEHRAAKMHAPRYHAAEAMDAAAGITYPPRTP
jgi:hypothetical protein